MRSVLILGGRAPVALDHARRFHRQGWRVVVGDSIPCRLSAFSRAVHASVRLASPRHAPTGFVTGLRAAIDQHRIDLVVPTCEEAFHLSRHRDALPAGTQYAVDGFEQLRALHSKWTFLGLAQHCGAHVPDSARVHSIEQAREWAKGAPVVLKPEYSRFGVHVRLHPHGMPEDAPPLAQAGAWVVQRFHAGTEACSYSVAHAGRLLAHACYRPKHRLGASSSYYFAPHRSEAIRGFVETFVRKIGYTGQIAFDWIEGADGTATVLECNPRAVSGVHLFAPDDALPDALCGQGDACVEPAEASPRMLAAIMLGAGGARALRTGRMGEWRQDWRRARDVIGVAGDRAPLAGAIADLAAYAWSAWRSGNTLREAATQDIEWDGEPLPDA
ncbi:hypothetical protein LYSHEL_01880 [Lysobacter helvus]|uniref:ATP-grasp domain-containing protein n=2 Tax=Lysobacteraceae TaxID=32033 RepID=A0ABN6FPB5_9GAMM|nr:MULTISPECIES: ATP-grasp domain-containing protein [Lysobacter]BCT91164.1 hypothetical protein LYSCAS_01880 [Lysobacter caseinilyticus]BCT94317.1 hypothetical protein LYSHEL_01880 [Lysobacter helvus]